jgi:hypothetical protein
MTETNEPWVDLLPRWRFGYLDIPSLIMEPQGSVLRMSIEYADEASVVRAAGSLDLPIVRDSCRIAGVEAVTIRADGEVTLIVQEAFLDGQTVRLEGSNGNVAIRVSDVDRTVSVARTVTDMVERRMWVVCCEYNTWVPKGAKRCLLERLLTVTQALFNSVVAVAAGRRTK